MHEISLQVAATLAKSPMHCRAQLDSISFAVGGVYVIYCSSQGSHDPMNGRGARRIWM